MNEHGVLAVISGFSGAGKGTLMKALLEKYDNYALSISATTRNPREGEVDGREYFFVTEDRFKEMMEQGKDVLLEIEIQGALKVKERFPEAILIFVMPPNAEELKRRLIGRGTESMDVINARLRRAVEEAEGMDSYDYILINDEISSCTEQLHKMIAVQHSRVSNNLAFLSQIREELKNI